MSQPNAKTEVTLDIERMSYGPYGIGRHNGRVFMVPYTGPGDRIVARVAQDHERFSIAEIVRIISPSAARRPAPCPAFGFCGGCSWQHINYATQLQAKQQSVDDALCRIGKLDGYELRPIIPSPQAYGYRRRIRLQVGPGGTLGFFSASSHDLVQIESCGIAAPALNECLPALKRWVRRIGTALNEIELVSADEAYRLIVAARASGPFLPADEAACAELVAREGIQGLLLRGPGWQKRWGETQADFEIAPGMTLKATADVFMQVNAAGNRLMLGSLLSLAEFRPDERVLDQRGLPLQHQQRRCAVGGERGDGRAADEVRVRPARATRRRGQGARRPTSGRVRHVEVGGIPIGRALAGGEERCFGRRCGASVAHRACVARSARDGRRVPGR